MYSLNCSRHFKQPVYQLLIHDFFLDFKWILLLFNVELYVSNMTTLVCDSVIVFCLQLEGADSRKRSVEAGLIETVLKLVDGPEPIQVQCMVVAVFDLPCAEW